MTDQAQQLRDFMQHEDPVQEQNYTPQTAQKAEVITITSGKGGVGKSNIAVNLAIALSQKGLEVAVADMDLGLANVNVITDLNADNNLKDVLDNRCTMDEILQEGPGGIKVLPGVSGDEALANLGPEECNQLLSEIAHLDSDFDVLIVDTAAGVSGHVMHFVCAADRTFLVTTPEPTAITDAYAVMKTALSKDQRPRFEMIVNRARTIMEAKKIGDKMKRVGNEFLNMPLNVLGYVVEDDTVERSVRNRRPFVLEHPDGEASRCVQHLSERILTGEDVPEPAGVQGFFSNVMDWFN